MAETMILDSKLLLKTAADKSMLIKPIRTNESTTTTILDIVRLSFSLFIFCFATIGCGYAMYASVTLMPDTIPNWAVYIIFFCALFLLMVTEGLHVAAVQVAYHDPNQYRVMYPHAAEIIEYDNKGRNLQHFLIGRQIVVCFCVFVLGRCTTFDSFFISLPTWFIDVTMYSGFFGVIFVVQIAQITPQIFSSNFAVQFLNILGVKYIFYFCIIIEKTGICHCVWLFSWFILNTSCFKRLCCSESYDISSSNNDKPKCIDQSSKFNEAMNCDYKIKKKIVEFINNLRNDLKLDDERNHHSDEKRDEEKTPLIADMDSNVIPYIFPTKLQCAQTFADQQLNIPDFLLNENDPNYVPAHLILLHVLQMNLR